MNEVLTIKDLWIELDDGQAQRDLLSGICMGIGQGETVALVGGSGGGKTSLGLAILQLLPAAMNVQKGEILFKGEDLLHLTAVQLQQVRGKEIGMVFQEPLSAFNPVFRIGDQIAEVIQAHVDCSRSRIRGKVLELLDIVEISEPERIAQSYPHQLSAGLRQRAMIAQAIAASPQLIIADEPTSNLDVTVQARIIELFAKLRKQLGLSLLLITHDLGLVNVMADRVFVLFEGEIVEQGKTKSVLQDPQHDFTKRLTATINL